MQLIGRRQFRRVAEPCLQKFRDFGKCRVADHDRMKPLAGAVKHQVHEGHKVALEDLFPTVCDDGQTPVRINLRAAETGYNLVDLSAQTEHTAGAHRLGPGASTAAFLPEAPRSGKSIGQLLQLPLRFANLYQQCAGRDLPLSDRRIAGRHRGSTAHRVFDAGRSRRRRVLRHAPRLRANFVTLSRVWRAGQRIASQAVREPSTGSPRPRRRAARG